MASISRCRSVRGVAWSRPIPIPPATKQSDPKQELARFRRDVSHCRNQTENSFSTELRSTAERHPIYKVNAIEVNPGGHQPLHHFIPISVVTRVVQLPAKHRNKPSGQRTSSRLRTTVAVQNTESLTAANLTPQWAKRRPRDHFHEPQIRGADCRSCRRGWESNVTAVRSTN